MIIEKKRLKLRAMIRKFARFMKPYRVQFILAILCIVLESCCEVFLPFLMNVLVKNGINSIDDFTYTMDANYVLMIGGIMIGISVLSFGLGVCSAKFSAIACRGFGYEIRKAEYQKIQSYSFKNLDEFRASSLITRLTNDVQILNDTLCISMRPALRAPFMLIFSLTFALIISPTLSVVFFVALIFLGAMIFSIVHIVKPRFLMIQKLLDNINRVTQESIIAIKTIKAYYKKDFEIEKFNKANQELTGTARKTLSINALAMPAGQLANYGTMIAIIYFGGMLYMQPGHAIALEDIQTFLTYVMQLLATIMMLSNVLMSINRATASFYRVNEVLDAQSEIVDKKDSKLTLQNGDVEFKNVYFKYKKDAKEYVLKNINFSIKNGDFVGIIGQTGSSKSTLISLIDRFYDASEGEILIGDKDIKDYSLYELREGISISFQSPLLFKGTVLDNLKWGNKNATMEEIEKACKIAECYDFITKQLNDGFNTMISQGGTSVSGGQRQRLCIARAILKKPKILILDDSFSALDKITEAKVKENLRKDLPNLTKIVISQKISAIKDADKIIVLDNGTITNIGTHEELLLKDEIYKDIDNLQKIGGSENA